MLSCAPLLPLEEHSVAMNSGPMHPQGKQEWGGRGGIFSLEFISLFITDQNVSYGARGGEGRGRGDRGIMDDRMAVI